LLPPLYVHLRLPTFGEWTYDLGRKRRSGERDNYGHHDNFLPSPVILALSAKRRGAVEGSIYTHPDIAQITYQHRPIRAAEVDHYHINSLEVQQLDQR